MLRRAVKGLSSVTAGIPGSQVQISERARSVAQRIGVPFLLLAPTLLGLAFLVYYPLGTAGVLSAFRYFWNKPTSRIAFVGWENYVRVFADETFWQAARNTGVVTIFSTGITMVCGLALATLFDRKFVGKSIFTSLVLLPIMVPPVASGLTWKFLFDGTFGWVNYFMRILGFAPRAWLSSTGTALATIIVADVWQWTPFVFLVTLAGLQALSPDILDAARVDGTSPFQLFRRVTLPLLMPVLAVVLILRLMDSFRIFDLVYVMTNGGPAGSTTTIGFLLYQLTFRYFNVGQGSVLALVMLLTALVLSLPLIQRLLQRVREA